MDPNNAVIQLCVRGMREEAEGRPADARAAFLRAWNAATDDYERCVAAHYLARHQPTPEETLRWNQQCLDLADAVGDERVGGFYASLHTNMGRAHQALGHVEQARRHYRLAAAHLADAPDDGYGEWVRYGIAEGLRATGGAAPRPAEETLRDLLNALCARADLLSLCLLLPAYVGDLGGQEDLARLDTAMRRLHATRRLPDEEQAALTRAIDALQGAHPSA
ncbi:hypothetical protein [Allostreptomyces psammosilenae]|uniref:Tetratricopeptide (TPR) repeat protein n=1 Tax=Allostreptomyces psammosilenae TaxID=1892865 RepID=A0A852ZZT3_9ACTN|nr:hypothetical protein [Allostreptomyces psammosilenae]NYI06730.1 tetratricopeptide (TPR) repeat protein [Allostreptomyces psammosilenae]